MQSAEELAQQAITTARRAEVKTDALANILLEQGQALGRLERVVKQVQGELRVGLQTIRERLPPRRTETFSHEDFQETATGSFRVTKDTVERVLGEREIKRDAQSWRALWRRVRWAVVLVAGGALGYGGEQLLIFLQHHL